MTSRLYLGTHALILAILLIGCTGAISRATAPEDAARQYLTAMAKENYVAAAALMHPDGLQEYREVMLLAAESMTDGGPDDAPVTGMPGIETLGELKALSPSEFFVRFYSYTTSQMAGIGAMVPLGQFDAGLNATVIGSVEDAAMVYVVYRSDKRVIGDTTQDEVDVLSLRRNGENWAVLLPRELERGMTLMREVTKRP